MIAIVITCDKSGEQLNLTKEYGVTSLKQAYFMLKNGEIDGRIVERDGEYFLHYRKG